MRADCPADTVVPSDISEGREPPESSESANVSLGHSPLVVVVVGQPSTPGQCACKPHLCLAFRVTEDNLQAGHATANTSRTSSTTYSKHLEGTTNRLEVMKKTRKH